VRIPWIKVKTWIKFKTQFFVKWILYLFFKSSRTRLVEQRNCGYDSCLYITIVPMLLHISIVGQLYFYVILDRWVELLGELSPLKMGVCNYDLLVASLVYYTIFVDKSTISITCCNYSSLAICVFVVDTHG